MRADQASARTAQLHGVSDLTASALVTAVGDMRQFKSARQFSVWVGLVPSQNSSGRKLCWRWPTRTPAFSGRC
ncbi:transposase [Kinneretia aquatilis]|uniref:transposase n=1 Tax=Kinneretia aquatilis TaxID=2070761 RepID=UPI0037422FCB